MVVILKPCVLQVFRFPFVDQRRRQYCTVGAYASNKRYELPRSILAGAEKFFVFKLIFGDDAFHGVLKAYIETLFIYIIYIRVFDTIFVDFLRKLLEISQIRKFYGAYKAYTSPK